MPATSTCASCGSLAGLLLLAALLACCAPRAQSQASSQPAQPKVTIVPANGAPWKLDLAPLHKTIDLSIGETQEVHLPNGAKATVKLLGIDITRDDLRQAIRRALVKLSVNGQQILLTSALYNLPQSVGGVQVDCPAVGALKANSGKDNPWGIEKDARIRIWPAGSPWIQPGTFVYPLHQRWFAGPTQTGNEPTYVDGVEQPLLKSIYYHYGFDIGGAEGLIDVLSTTDGLVVCAGNNVLEGFGDPPVQPRYDNVSILDRRGWCHRYRHLLSIDPAVKVGQTIKMGAKIGVLGKEGASGGWSHLHYQIDARQPSGEWGIEEAYAFTWQACLAQQTPSLIAVARPHTLAPAGSTVELNGEKSWSAAGKIQRYDWTFTDGQTASGPTVRHTYLKSGQYSEILKITDIAGNVAYDFAIVQIEDKDKPRDLPPGIQLAYAPTMGIHPAAEVTFKVRSFGTTFGQEAIDFGDGTPPKNVKSDGDVDPMAKNGFAVLTHSFTAPGIYIVTARRSNERSQEGVARVLVVVEK